MARYLYGGREEQAKAAIRREADARVLRQERHWRGAMYLLGYAIECKLKRRLMEKYRVLTLDELERKLSARFKGDIRLTGGKGHNIAHLLELFGEDARQKMDPRISIAFHQCARWHTAWRYDPNEGNETECKVFFEAAEQFVRFVTYSM